MEEEGERGYKKRYRTGVATTVDSGGGNGYEGKWRRISDWWSSGGKDFESD